MMNVFELVNILGAIVRIEDPDHSDFVALRSVLFGSHLQELRDLTHEVLYEKYRTEKLEAENGGGELSPGRPHIHVHHHGPALPPTIVHSELLYKEQQRLREIKEAAQKAGNIWRKPLKLMQRESELRDIRESINQTRS